MLTKDYTRTSLVQDFFDSRAANWDTRCHGEAKILRAIVQTTNPLKHARMLDIACGTGVMFEALLERSPALLRAIDLSPEMAKIASQKYGRHPQLQISAEDFYSFDETGFDYIMVYNAYPHFMDKQQFAKQAAKCLAPGGRLVIAHGFSRKRINACHEGSQVSTVSTELLGSSEEAARLSQYFAIDIQVDNKEMYIVSGCKK